MGTTAPIGHDSDLLNLADKVEELRGCYVYVQEAQRVSVGVVVDIFADGKLLVFTVEQQMFHAKGGFGWTTDPVATTYHAVDGDALTYTDGDGSISVVVPHEWSVKILPAEVLHPVEVFDI